MGRYTVWTTDEGYVNDFDGFDTDDLEAAHRVAQEQSGDYATYWYVYDNEESSYDSFYQYGKRIAIGSAEYENGSPIFLMSDSSVSFMLKMSDKHFMLLEIGNGKVTLSHPLCREETIISMSFVSNDVLRLIEPSMREYKLNIQKAIDYAAEKSD